ncbi:MAG TPA: YhjD/YihY/BrkB family envelope integrity protein [Syntrophorhabdaceae bacterium]|nr:YhjD/YihY/BrkB family envelope integrity protein [Syntrophorhabdaceae bacterium]HOD74393.1 YhjD/YihY/BrkB family envelope integrity protein [Syntrophorhabdaceae bacterium]
MTSLNRVSPVERLGRSLRVAGIVLRESLRSFLGNNDFEMSAALATYSFFALVPLLFLVAAFAADTGGTATWLIAGIEGLIDHLFPRIRDWMSVEFSAAIGHPLTLGGAAAVVVFIAAMSLVDSLRTAFLKIFRKNPPASLFTVQFGNVKRAAAMLLLFAVLIGAEIAHLAIGNILRDRLLFTSVGTILVSICVAALCMAFFYRVFLPVRLTAFKLTAVCVISAVLIILMREVFAFVLRTNPAYGETFGSLKVLFVMIVWVYYCFLAILFGAELAVNTGKRDALLLKRLFAGNVQRALSKGLLARFIRSSAKNDVIFEEGDPGGAMYYIVSGSVDIMRGGKHILTMHSGDYFGEISMLLGTPRSAAARAADEPTELVAISQGNFDLILRDNAPIVLSLLKELAGRLKDTDESLLGRQRQKTTSRPFAAFAAHSSTRRLKRDR